jgi:hypothetical protein
MDLLVGQGTDIEAMSQTNYQGSFFSLYQDTFLFLPTYLPDA